MWTKSELAVCITTTCCFFRDLGVPKYCFLQNYQLWILKMQVSFWIQIDFAWLYGTLSSWTVVSGTRSSFGSFAGCHWWASLAKFSSGRTENDSMAAWILYQWDTVLWSCLIWSFRTTWVAKIFSQDCSWQQIFFGFQRCWRESTKTCTCLFCRVGSKHVWQDPAAEKQTSWNTRFGFAWRGGERMREGFFAVKIAWQNTSRKETSYCWCHNLDVWYNGDTNKR